MRTSEHRILGTFDLIRNQKRESVENSAPNVAVSVRVEKRRPALRRCGASIPCAARRLVDLLGISRKLAALRATQTSGGFFPSWLRCSAPAPRGVNTADNAA